MSPATRRTRVPRPTRFSRRLRLVAMGFVLAGAVYMLLIDTSSLPELYAGAAVALIAALVFEASREQGLAEASARPAWVLRAWRAVARIPVDVCAVSAAALQQVFAPVARRGVVRTAPFKHGTQTSARDAGRRALAEALGSLAPNTIVIGVDPQRDVIVVHQLREGGDTRALDVLGLG
jgi:multisubunit Na+/H+ antiporter MnhE subunit